MTRAGNKTLFLLVAFLLFALGAAAAHAVPPGTVISNTADATFDNAGSAENRTSNSVAITTTLTLTPTDIAFFQYSPTGTGATPTLSSPSGCSLGGPGGPFPPLANPTFPGAGVLDTSLPVNLVAAANFHQGEPVFVKVQDANRNIDRNSRDTVQILLDVAATGDLEQLELSETGIDTGVFVGYIQSVAPAATSYDCQLAIGEENIIRVSYVDIYDSSDTASSTALVDPFGTVFDSVTGSPVDGASITILDALTGLPAQVFGDDGVSTFPATVTSGGTATDSGGTLYNFPPGDYRFPFMAPGSYRIEVSATNYDTPSTRTIAELQTLPNAPFTLDAQASFGQDFALVAGPPLNIDLPADAIPSELFLTKTASLERASIGDFVQYNLELTNNQNTGNASNTVIRDVLPVGFRYQKGSIRQDGSSGPEPKVSGDGRRLTFTIGNLGAGQNTRLSYVLEVTSGTQMGNVVNRATASDAAGTLSNTAKASVFIEDDLISSQSFILGRVIQGNCEIAGPTVGALQLHMQSTSEGNRLEQKLTVAGTDLMDQQLALAVQLPGMLHYEHGSVRINGVAAAEPESRDGTLWFTLPGNDASVSHTIEYRLTPGNSDVGDFTIRARAVSLDQDDLQQSTAWAVNAISRSNTGKQLTVTRADSGKLTTRILNSRRYNHKPTVGTDLDGVAGVRLVMEDGRYVITDEKGLYHFEGLPPGTHVVQIDPNSLPENLEVFECEQNTRFAGDADSQFVDLQGGLIWRSDFYVREKAPLKGNIGIRLESSLDRETVEYRVTLAGDTHAYRNLRMRVMLAEGLAYVPGSARLEDTAIADPEIKSGILTFKLGGRRADNWKEKLTFRAQATPAGQGELSTQAILSFDTGEEKNRHTLPAVNSLRYQSGAGSIQHYAYQAHFDSLKSTLQPQQRKALIQFINGLVNQGIDRVTLVDGAGVNGHTDNRPIAERSRHLFRDNQALSLARAATVGQLVREILGLEKQQIIIAGKGRTQPVADNSTESGRARNRRAELVITLSDKQTDAILETGRADSGMQTVTISKAHAAADEQPASLSLPVAAETVDYDRNWLDAAAPGLEWLSPAAEDNPEIPSISIAIKHDAAHRLELLQNGKPVDPANFDGSTLSTDKLRSITRWRGVDLDVGDNRFEVTAYDKNGAVTGTQSQVIHFSGMPVKAEFVKQYSQLQANGSAPVVVAIRFYDRWGKPVRKGVIGKYRLNPPYVSAQTVDALRKQPLSGAAKGETTYRIDNDGVALIGIEPTTRSGKATLTFEFADDTARIPSIKRLATITKRQEQEINVWLQGAAGDWILVGLAEGTTGYNTVSGNQEALDDSNTSENYFKDDRLAFYAKGRIKGKWLLTLAYDSENQTHENKDRNSLFQTINPDKYYTLYGDASEQYFDAPSSDQLYVRLERGQFYAMYGDFDTGLTVTELSRYSRSMTGARTEYEGKHFGFNAFAAGVNQTFIRDEIQGNGTSGLYKLSEKNVVINSDKVTIETRDRFQSQLVLEKRELTRFLDYNIDTLNGTLFFKQPVSSKDSNFNPIYIVANYEVTGASGKKITGGGRGHIKLLDDHLEVGITGIHQGDTGTGGDLAGGDLRYKITGNTELRAEVAGSNTDTASTSASGKAWLAELDHNSERADARLYYRKQEKDFGLGQQNNSDAGTKRFGVDGRYRATDSLYLNGEAYRDEVLTTNAKRNVATAGVEYHYSDYVLSTGLSWAQDSLDTGARNNSTLLTANASRAFLNNRLNLHAGTELALGNNDNVDFPTRYTVGGDYQLIPNIDLFAEQEFTQGKQFDSNTTRVGFRSTPWQMATVNSSLEQQVTENNLRLFSNLGLTQGLQVNEHLLVNFGLDRSQTLNDSGGVTPLNTKVPLSSGSVNGDFNAVFLGGSYTRELWSATSRIEYRDSDENNQRGLFLGLYRQHTPGMGLSMAAQLLDSDANSGSDTRSADVRFSLAYRPVASRWIVLDRLDLNFEDTGNGIAAIRNRKIVNNLNLNYLYDRSNQLALHHGIKYANTTTDGKDYNGITQVLGSEYRHDINARWDVGIHGDIMHSSNSNVFRYSAGPSVGVNLFRNVWLSVGYNITGFEDNDFSSAEYTTKGPFIKFRFKFGTRTVKELVSWVDK